MNGGYDPTSSYLAEDDELLAEILSMDQPEKSWLEPLANDFRDAKLESAFSDGLGDVLNDPSDPLGDTGGSRAIPVGRLDAQGDTFLSYDSSTSFLGNGSLAGQEKSTLMRNSSGVLPPAMPGSGRLTRPNSVPSLAPLGIASPAPAHTVRVRGGVWKWIPDHPDNQPPGPPPPPPDAQMRSVPVKTGRLPLATSQDIGIHDRDVIDSFDILEMADTLIFENGARRDKAGRPNRHITNSCPAPATSLFQDDRSDFSTPSQSRIRSRPTGSSVAIPVMMSRSTSTKINRCSRSQSSPHASNLLASSIPSNRVGSYGGSFGGSLGRSHSLLNSDSISEDKTEAFDPDYEFSTMTPSYSSRSLDTHGNPKKKHNPWTALETVSLINGVEELGVGKWADIKRAPEFEQVFEWRSAVDLKDKWRNLTRLAKLPVAKLEEKVAKDMNRSGESIPLEAYLQIRRIAGIS